jgi:Zn-dependent metalloprotease
MKKALLISLFVLLYGGGRVSFAQTSSVPQYKPKYLRENDQNFKNLTTKTTENGWIEFKKEARINPNTFFKDYANSLGLGQHYDFKKIKEETDRKQNKHQRFQLHYKNILVEGAEFTLHSSIEGVLVLGHGRIPENLDVDVNTRIPEPRALDVALASMKLSMADFKKSPNNKQNGELVIARLADDAIVTNFKLAYKFDIYGNETLNAFKVYIEATTGQVLKRTSLIKRCFTHSHTPNTPKEPPTTAAVVTPIAQPLVASTFVPNYSRYLNGQSSLAFETELSPPNTNQYRLSAFNNALNTRMANQVSNIWQNLPDVINNNGDNDQDWTMNANRNAQTAHWLAQKMYQLLSQTPNIERKGINNPQMGQGSYPLIVTDGTEPGSSWGFGQLTMGTANNGSSEATADFVGHEYMHAVSEYTANLIYEGQSGALDESIADIFGTALERNILPNNNTPNGWNWLIGEDLGLNRHFRDMANPGSIPLEPDIFRIPQPDRYLGPNWQDPTNLNVDNGGVHINSGILNKWFQTICTGQCLNPAIQINPIAFDKATAIVYRALTVYLQSWSNYPDMANATIQSARDLYGNCSIEEESVQNAWSAANIGGLYFRSCGGTGGGINGCYTIRAKHSNKILQPENGNNSARIRQYDAKE